MDNWKMKFIIIYYTENNPQLGDGKVCESNEGPSHCYQLLTWIYGFSGFCFPKQFGIALRSVSCAPNVARGSGLSFPIKTYISNVVRTIRFWNNLRHILSLTVSLTFIYNTG
jgi:hypothetical protein